METEGRMETGEGRRLMVARPVARRPDPGMPGRLEDASAWTTATGERLAPASMTTEHLRSVLGYCRWHAEDLLDDRPVPPPADIDAWLAARPILRAIAGELAARGAAASPEAAWADLRAGGRVPWEIDRERRGARRAATGGRGAGRCSA